MVILVVGSKAKAIDPRDLYICARPKMREARENENENENEIFIKKKHDGKKKMCNSPPPRLRSKNSEPQAAQLTEFILNDLEP